MSDGGVTDKLKLAGIDDTPRRVHVFLPRGFENSTLRYPVVYFNDGQSTFFDGGASGGSFRLSKLLSREEAGTRLPKVIVVAIWPIDRGYEYSYAQVKSENCCGVRAYADYLADRLKPFVDRNYPTHASRTHTYLAGSSRGGLAALFTLFRRRESFGGAIVQSASLWAGLDNPEQEQSEKESKRLNFGLLSVLFPRRA